MECTWSLRWQQRPAPSSSRSVTLTSSQTLTQSSPNPHKPSLNPHLILTSSSPSLVTDDGLYQLQRWPLPTKLCRHTNPTLASLHRCVLSPLFFRYFPVSAVLRSFVLREKSAISAAGIDEPLGPAAKRPGFGQLDGLLPLPTTVRELEAQGLFEGDVGHTTAPRDEDAFMYLLRVPLMHTCNFRDPQSWCSPDAGSNCGRCSPEQVLAQGRGRSGWSEHEGVTRRCRKDEPV